LGANTKHDGYFEGNVYQVTYTLGIYVPWKNRTITNRIEKLGFEQPAHAREIETKVVENSWSKSNLKS
jgi:DNA topoisomerase-3